ncbi:MAG: fluoride efflux transporter CrcB [Rhodobacteraceae bacterium]|nr:fluoride efflux transporter CrcB [Paracoccaceae bacterium]
MPIILQVGLGGAIGAMLRYGSVKSVVQLLGLGFPYGTLFVNVVGSLIMGALVVYLLEKTNGRLSPFLMTGILGGFTTFSAFSLDAVGLMEKGRLMAAMIYMGGSVVLAVAALFAGMALTKALMT